MSSEELKVSDISTRDKDKNLLFKEQDTSSNLSLGSLLSQDMAFRKAHHKGFLQERMDKLKSFIKYWKP